MSSRPPKEKSGDTYKHVPTYAKFVIGGTSGMIAQATTHPMDVLKVRMQVSKAKIYDTLAFTYKDKGVFGFYTGLSAGLLRQVTYSTTRLGIYNTLTEYCQEQFGRLNYPALVSLGMISGIVGAFVGTPADVVMIRMIADIKLVPEERRNYRNALVGLVRIIKDEGFTSMWRGAIPTMGRAAIVNGAQLGTYSRAKMFLYDTGLFEEGILLQFVASMISGFVTAISSLPVDIAKTRIQNWKESTKAPNTVKMIHGIAKTDGIFSLWRGFIPYYGRICPNTVITMVCMDQLTRIFTYTFL